MFFPCRSACPKGEPPHHWTEDRKTVLRLLAVENAQQMPMVFVCSVFSFAVRSAAEHGTAAPSTFPRPARRRRQRGCARCSGRSTSGNGRLPGKSRGGGLRDIQPMPCLRQTGVQPLLPDLRGSGSIKMRQMSLPAYTNGRIARPLAKTHKRTSISGRLSNIFRCPKTWRMGGGTSPPPILWSIE